MDLRKCMTMYVRLKVERTRITKILLVLSLPLKVLDLNGNWYFREAIRSFIYHRTDTFKAELRKSVDRCSANGGVGVTIGGLETLSLSELTGPRISKVVPYIWDLGSKI